MLETLHGRHRYMQVVVFRHLALRNALRRKHYTHHDLGGENFQISMDYHEVITVINRQPAIYHDH
jgi:hypothetical protein